MIPDSDRPIERGDWVVLRALLPQAHPMPQLVTLVLSTGVLRLLDREGYYATHLFKRVPPPTETQIVKRLKARGTA